MKLLLVISIVITIVLCTCAKWVEPITYEDILEIEHIYLTTGYVLDAYISDNIIYVAQDQTGIILFNRSYGDIIWEKSASYTKYITVSEQDSFMVSYENDYFHTYIFTNLDSISEIGSPLKDDYSRYPKLINVSINKDAFKISYIKKSESKLKIQEYYLVSGIWFLSDNSTYFTIPDKELMDYEIKEDYIYFAANQWGLIIIDYNEQIIGIADTPGQALAVKVVGDYAYIADREAGLQVIDISDVENPELVYSFDTSGLAQSVDVEEDYLVVGSGGGGLYLFDVSDKSNPKFLDRIDDSEIGFGYTYKAFLSNMEVFAATRIGVVKLKIND